MLQAPLNAHVTRESLDKQIHSLTQGINPIYRFQILLNGGSSLHYPYTVKKESDSAHEGWRRDNLSSPAGSAVWHLPTPLEDPVPGAERIVLPVSIPLGPPSAPLGTAAILVSGRYIDRILSNADNLPHGLQSQYFIAKDGRIKLERINNGDGKAPTVNLEKGEYPDPWLIEWLAGKEYDAVIRKEPGGPFVYCFALVPAMEEWYVEKIRLREFLHSVDPDRKGGLQ